MTPRTLTSIAFAVLATIFSVLAVFFAPPPAVFPLTPGTLQDALDRCVSHGGGRVEPMGDGWVCYLKGETSVDRKGDGK